LFQRALIERGAEWDTVLQIGQQPPHGVGLSLEGNLSVMGMLRQPTNAKYTTALPPMVHVAFLDILNRVSGFLRN
jgi:hypothetical protein